MSKLFVSTSVLALLCASAAHAQDSRPTQNGSAAPGQTQSAPAEPASSDDIVVTAERRTTSLQRTPIAATVLTGAELTARGVTTVDQIQQIAPSTTVQNFGQGNSFNIRGIGKSESNSNTGVGVITYRDGVASFPGYLPAGAILG